MKPISLRKWSWVTLSLLGIFEGCNGFKALFVFPFPAKSHFGVFIVLAEELARRGHDVTVLSHFPREKANYREIIMDSKPFEKIFDGSSANVTAFRHGNMFLSELFFYKIMSSITEIAFKDKAFLDLFATTEHYDVILGELSFSQPYIAVIGHKLGAPIVDLCPAAAFTHILYGQGNPLSLSHYPNFRLPLSDRMSFWERLKNFAICLFQVFGDIWIFLPAQDALVRKYMSYPEAKSMPLLSDLVQNVSLTLLNTHFSTSYSRPYAPNMIEIAGMHLKPAKKLPQDLQKFMDEAEHGVIYFSFGSVVKKHMFSEERIRSIAAALKRLPQRVIMKWEDPAPFLNAKNVLVLSWTPQQDILGHPKLLLFVTHGGYNSLIEATRAGVPVLGIPVFADQFHNIVFYEHRGIGKGLDLEAFTGDSLYNTIVHIINTPSYRQNAKEIALRTQDRPQSALETAIFWIEYVVRHKGAHHLKPASAYLPFYQRALLDIIGALFLVMFVVYKLVRQLCCKLYSRPTAAKKETENKKKN